MSHDRSFLESFQGDLAKLANNLQRLAAESIYPLNPQAAQAKACEILGYCGAAQSALRNCDGLAARLAPAMPNPGHVETDLRIWLEVVISVLGSVALDLPGGDDDADGVWVPRSEPTWPGSKDWFAKNESDLIEASDRLAGIANTLGPCICSLHGPLPDSSGSDEVWLFPPLPLADIANRLGNITTRKAKGLLTLYGLKNNGNRQLWTVRLDQMPPDIRERLTASAPKTHSN